MYPHWDHMDKAGEGTFHRALGEFPNILVAQDVFVWEDGHLVIKNPSKPYRPAY